MAPRRAVALSLLSALIGIWLLMPGGVHGAESRLQAHVSSPTPTANVEPSPMPPPPLPATRPPATIAVTPTSTLTPTQTPTVTPTPGGPTATATPTLPPVAFSVYGANLQRNWKADWKQDGPALTSIKRGTKVVLGIYVASQRIPTGSKMNFLWIVRQGRFVIAHHGHHWSATTRQVHYWDHWAHTFNTPATYRFTGTVVIGGVRHHRSLIFHVVR